MLYSKSESIADTGLIQEARNGEVLYDRRLSCGMPLEMVMSSIARNDNVLYSQA